MDHFELPLKLNVLIESVDKFDKGFKLSSEEESFEAKNVIVATGPFHTPYTPACHQNVSKDVLQIHSNFYKAPSQLDSGDALVVGGGDSGYQILDEISKDISRQVYFSGDTNVKSIPQHFLGKTLWWWFSKIGFLSYNKYSWIGKKLNSTTQPVIGTDVKEILSRDNVHIVGRTQDASNEEIVFEKKAVSSIQNIVWATGYRPNFTWIKGLELDTNGYPKNFRGVSSVKGLYFIGLPWMYTRGSATLGGVSKDAQYLANYIQN